MSARAHRQHAQASPGFVLVGVVMMVLALTILGFSLFSLSSYEAQFMNRSLDQQQALQLAMGGLERARFALGSAPDTLGMVKLGLPYENVVWARASQVRTGITPDSSGPLEWNGDWVTIEVLAQYKGISRRLSAQYKPSLPDNYYKRLATVQNSFEVNDKTLNPPVTRTGTVNVNGRVWEYNNGGPTDTLVWQANARSFPFPGVRRTPMPIPDAGPFINLNKGGAQPPNRTQVPAVGVAATVNYDLSGPTGEVTYWYSNTGNSNFSVYETSGATTIRVNGKAVWLLPRGIRFDAGDPVKVESAGDPKACLVIVAQEGIDPYQGPGYFPHPSIWFFGGGLTTNIPVILVSDQQVLIEQFYNTGLTTDADKLSIFARDVFLTGPETGAVGLPAMNVAYAPAIMDAQVDTLMAHDALPNSVTTIPFTFRPGSWRPLQ